MTVFENVLVAAAMGARLRGRDTHDKALETLELTGMLGLGNRRADTLGLLDRKRLELARALATAPVLLLLDEIAGGLTEPETLVLVDQIERAARQRPDDRVDRARRPRAATVAERLICLAAGTIIADGEPQTVMSDRAVVDAYLGSAA